MGTQLQNYGYHVESCFFRVVHKNLLCPKNVIAVQKS